MEREELLQYERQFSSILVNIPLGWIMLDSGWNIFFVNDHLLDITGWKREEVLSKKFADMFVPDGEREKVVATQLLISGGLMEISPYDEKEVLLKNGKTLVFEWNNSIIRNSAGKFLGISSFGKPKAIPITQLLVDTQLADINELRDDANSRIIGDYILLKALGGENGHVQLAVHKTTHNKVAVKSLKKEQMNKEFRN